MTPDGISTSTSRNLPGIAPVMYMCRELLALFLIFSDCCFSRSINDNQGSALFAWILVIATDCSCILMSLLFLLICSTTSHLLSLYSLISDQSMIGSRLRLISYYSGIICWLALIKYISLWSHQCSIHFNRLLLFNLALFFLLYFLLLILPSTHNMPLYQDIYSTHT